LINVTSVAAGTDHSLALTRDGHVIGWGRNSNGQTNVPSYLSSAVQIFAGPICSVALQAHGFVTTWGSFWLGAYDPRNWSRIVSVAAGRESVFGLKDSGTVTFNGNAFVQGALSIGFSNIVAIAVGEDNSSGTDTCLLLRQDGTVRSFGNLASLTNLPPGLKNVTVLAAGGKHALAMVGDGSPRLIRQSSDFTPPLGGTVSLQVMAVGAAPVYFQWLQNGIPLDGATNATLTLSNLDTAVDGAYSLLVSNAMQTIMSTNIQVTVVPVIVWSGKNQYQDLVPASVSDPIAIAGGQQMKAIRRDGTVISWGWKADPPLGLTNVLAIGGGSYHSLALLEDGTVTAWGDASLGPAFVPAGLTNVIAITAGDYNNLALKDDGTVFQWGADTAVPPDLSNVAAVACGDHHSLALRRDGTVVAWGDNSYGQTNVPADLNQVVAIAAAYTHCLALKRDGSVASWGKYTDKAAYVPAGVSNIIAISTCGPFCMALTPDGVVLTWDLSKSQSMSVLTRSFTNVVAISAGNYNLALVSPDPSQFSPALSNPALDGSSFSVSVPTRSGKVYLLEYQDSLADPAWTPLPLVAGNGRPRTLTAPAANNGTQRFYRVRQW
jgi:alpha-tubulin suppressor-like RCC1 family protein